MLRYLLTPIARFCVKRAIRLPEVVDVVKQCFVTSARDALTEEGLIPTAAKISVMTGVHRKDIRALMLETQTRVDPLQKHPLVRLLSFWTTDPEFFDAERNMARVLPWGDVPGTIGALLRRVGGDANPYSLLYALERSGLVERRSDDSFELVQSTFTTPPEQGWEMIAEIVGDAIACIDHNSTAPERERNLQLKTVFDNIPSRFEEQLRREIRERGARFQEELRILLAEYDRDMNPSLADIPDKAIEISCSVFGVVKKAN